jgi:hypothetical protein
MNYSEKLKAVTDWTYENVSSVDEFCVMFDIELEHLVKCFPDALVRSYNKVFPPDVDNDDLSDELEEDAWRGFHPVEED